MADEGKLTDEIIAGLGVGIHSDGGSLSIEIKKWKTKTSKNWRFAYIFAGKRSAMMLGAFPDTLVSEARKKRDDIRLMIKRGIEPRAEIKQHKDDKRYESAVIKITAKVTPEVYDQIKMIGCGSAFDGLRKIIDDFIAYEKHKLYHGIDDAP